ncbi:AI-2E family transporter [Prolixibacter sp. SD074]|uniref:AI-2E family transporter n=1 Tax=Prolixibacter sp. SD074 TaxID=2652391 RepID=UPI001275D9E4|nr:AI-2E family transporter [Prolixibacter sp. SD074]GET30547.1 AI-2E family transporter [Prolixibacter sp. SD074]
MEKDIKPNIPSYFYWSATIALIIVFLIVGRSILVPLAWAILFSFLLVPLVIFLEKHGWKRPLAILTSLVLFLIIIGAIFYFLASQVVAISSELPSITGKLSVYINDVKDFLESHFSIIPQSGDLQKLLVGQAEKVGSYFLKHVTTIGQTLMYVFLMPVFVYFLLYYRELPAKFVKGRYRDRGNRESVSKIFFKIQKMIRKYLVGVLWLTMTTAVMDFIVLISLGVNSALFFAAMIALLNLIPYVGNLIAMIVVVGYALLTSDSLLVPLLTLGLLWAANILQENLVRPWLVGSSTKINAFVVLISVIVGGMVWGVSGMVLFIPMVGVVKIILEEVPTLRPFAVFLSDTSNVAEEEEPENLDTETGES